MADLSKTISNSIISFGPAPSTKWGFSWGNAKWGEGTTDLIISFIKLITNSQSSDTTIIKSVLFNGFSNSLTFSFETSDEYLQDAAGYYRVFVGGVTDAEGRSTSTFTQVTNGSTSWSSGSTPSTTWSSS